MNTVPAVYSSRRVFPSPSSRMIHPLSSCFSFDWFQFSVVAVRTGKVTWPLRAMRAELVSVTVAPGAKVTGTDETSCLPAARSAPSTVNELVIVSAAADVASVRLISG